MNLIEITDNSGFPLVLMTEQTVKKKKLHRRIVFVILKDKKNKMLLVQRNRPNEKILWEFPCCETVYAGESAEGTVCRELEKNFSVEENIKIKEIGVFSFEHSETRFTAAVFSACLHHGLFRYSEERIKDVMFIDEEEFRGLLSFHPEMFAPAVLWASKTDWFAELAAF